MPATACEVPLELATHLGGVDALEFGPRGAPLVVALQGKSANPDVIAEWVPAARLLAGAGWRVVVPNLHSNELTKPGAVASKDATQVVRDIIRSEHNCGASCAVVMGKSWGGGEAVAFAAAHRAMVVALVLVAPSLSDMSLLQQVREIPICLFWARDDAVKPFALSEHYTSSLAPACTLHASDLGGHRVLPEYLPSIAAWLSERRAEALHAAEAGHAPEAAAEATPAQAQVQGEGLARRSADHRHSADLTRPRTLLAAIERLDLLHDSAAAAEAGGVLRCLILGADAREGASLEAACGGAVRLNVRFSCKLYHELTADELGAPPHVAVAFQAGVWGYDTWAPTVGSVLRSGCALVVTSYTILEAEDDEEALAAIGGMRWAWRPEPNPWRSAVTESRLNSRGDARDLAENAAWQCVLGTSRFLSVAVAIVFTLLQRCLSNRVPGAFMQEEVQNEKLDTKLDRVLEHLQSLQQGQQELAYSAAAALGDRPGGISAAFSGAASPQGAAAGAPSKLPVPMAGLEPALAPVEIAA
ncbi:hypothetical protein EMIHUDRAFT_239101 [Emiliania huxleyi CCMP1516]|uniref:Mitochondrial splicing suppressor 51-like C-terminal domain-containing protein n=2 Tax=Emiliania huxleyi TaxID=2903 RepID=A0A0D3JJV1_EMIH1|nr:hypothetical protein EMIHUDRAFT_239101 [Emiliania huxleyi CCMP1516]EOD23786.1 hypothetical protein EMIHUDRAFT_239101 [Emiliania huxleyi CCMP1516]|eukprot:XP_005776215.1 hypothetical protein EMIHUDRAFT_239101 [Emiliania huxleyi CCMP1516]